MKILKGQQRNRVTGKQPETKTESLQDLKKNVSSDLLSVGIWLILVVALLYTSLTQEQLLLKETLPAMLIVSLMLIIKVLSKE